MGWSETHRRWQVLRELETELTWRPTERGLPWREEYAELFGDRAGLIKMLRYRWELTRDAQIDPYLSEAALEEQRRSVYARFAGVRRFLEHYDAGGRAHAAA